MTQEQADYLDQLAAALRTTQERLTRLENESFDQLLAGGTDARAGAFAGGPQASPVGAGAIQQTAIIADDAVGSGAIRAGAVDITAFASTIAPVRLVSSLPSLPDGAYPIDTFAYDTTAKKMYKNVANVWEYIVGPEDITANEILANTITAGQIAAGAITASEIAAGAVTTAKLGLVDAGGTTLLDATGFGPTWARFIQSGIYNSNFASPPTTPGSAIDNSTNPLPGWTRAHRSGSSIQIYSNVQIGNASGRAIQFLMGAGAAGDDTYIEQIVPVLGSRARTFGAMGLGMWFSNAATGLQEVYTSAQYLQKDLTPIGTERYGAQTVTALSALPDDVGTTAARGSAEGSAPANAYYMRLRMGLRRATAATSASVDVYLVETFVSPASVDFQMTDYNDPTLGTTQLRQASGILYLWVNGGPTNAFQFHDAGGTRGMGFEISDAFIKSGGGTASMPAGPSTGDRWWNTDVDLEFFYNGTRWLSTQVFSIDLGVGALATEGNLSVDSANIWGANGIFLMGCSDAWIRDVVTYAFVLSGGSALSASHKWVSTVGKVDGTAGGATISNIATTNIDSGSSNVWRSYETPVGALWLNGTSYYKFTQTWTKTGTPGVLQPLTTIYYHLIP